MWVTGGHVIVLRVDYDTGGVRCPICVLVTRDAWRVVWLNDRRPQAGITVCLYLDDFPRR